MSITYEHTYNVKNIYNAFKKNRVNAVSYLGTSNNGKLEPDSSAYLSYINNSTETYIYARKSSPTIDDDTDKNYAYLKVGDTTYNFYHGHAYTYTETVTGNGIKPILIAYNFVNQISTYLEFDKVSISHNAAPISDIPQTVNVFSPVSYIIENAESSLDPKNEYFISRDEINTLLNGKTFADFTTYVTYSYLNSENGDGIVYEDGKDTLSTNPINDIHIWSLSDGVDMRPHAYVNNDTTPVNAYTYLNCGNILNTFFRNNTSNIFDYNDINYKYIKFYYDDISIPNTNGVLQRWKAGIVGTDKIYAKDERTGNNILDYSKFYQVCKVDLPNVSSFNEIYNKPSLRGNSDAVNCYINIKGDSNTSDNQESLYINKSNINKARFVKKINNLPQHMIPNNLRFKLSVKCGHINGGTIDGEGNIILNKIYVSFNPEKNSQDLLTIFDANTSFTVTTDNENNIYAHYISAGESEYLKVIDTHEVTADEIGNHDGQIDGIEAYVIYEFKTDKIYRYFESSYPNKTIRGIYIEGTNDVTIHPSGTSNAQYLTIESNNFILDGNTNYTGDYRGEITKTNNTEQILSNTIYLNFILPNN